MNGSNVLNILGLLYALAIILLSYQMLRAGRMTRRRVIVISIITTFVGFLLVAPLIPVQMQALALGNNAGGMPPLVQIIVISLLIFSSLLVGRVFCGYACPIGAVQELAYLTKVRKVAVNGKKVIAVHAAFFILFVTLSIASVSLLGALGLKQFFGLDISIPFFVFLAVISLAVIIYRPFCRFICPFGFLSGFLAERSMMAMGRGAGCNSCGACAIKCPVGDAKERQDGGDCFLCLRCSEACRKDTMKYSRRR